MKINSLGDNSYDKRASVILNEINESRNGSGYATTVTIDQVIADVTAIPGLASMLAACSNQKAQRGLIAAALRTSSGAALIHLFHPSMRLCREESYHLLSDIAECRFSTSSKERYMEYRFLTSLYDDIIKVVRKEVIPKKDLNALATAHGKLRKYFENGVYGDMYRMNYLGYDDSGYFDSDDVFLDKDERYAAIKKLLIKDQKPKSKKKGGSVGQGTDLDTQSLVSLLEERGFTVTGANPNPMVTSDDSEDDLGENPFAGLLVDAGDLEDDEILEMEDPSAEKYGAMPTQSIEEFRESVTILNDDGSTTTAPMASDTTSSEYTVTYQFFDEDGEATDMVTLTTQTNTPVAFGDNGDSEDEEGSDDSEPPPQT